MTKLYFAPDHLIDCQKLWYLKDLFEVSETPEQAIEIVWPCSKENCLTGTTNYVQDRPNVINGCVKSVLKSHVNDIQRQTFGYGSEAVIGMPYCKKHNGQAIKDIRFDKQYRGELQRNYFYQQDLRENGHTLEVRVLVFNRKPIDLACFKVAKDMKVKGEDLISLSKFMDKPLQNDLNRFCEAFCLDYGELDIIFSKDVMHVLDVNLTPGNRAMFTLPTEQTEILLSEYKLHFAELLSKYQHSS